jgi:hypothetical protein
MFGKLLKRIKTETVLASAHPRFVRGALAFAFMTLFAIASPASAFAEGELGTAFAGMAKTLINGIIILASLLLAVGIATNFLTGMIETMAGRPGGLSSTWMRIAGIVLCFVGALFSILISNAIIDGVTTGVTWNTNINVPGTK